MHKTERPASGTARDFFVLAAALLLVAVAVKVLLFVLKRRRGGGREVATNIVDTPTPVHKQPDAFVSAREASTANAETTVIEETVEPPAGGLIAEAAAATDEQPIQTAPVAEQNAPDLVEELQAKERVSEAYRIAVNAGTTIVYFAEPEVWPLREPEPAPAEPDVRPFPGLEETEVPPLPEPESASAEPDVRPFPGLEETEVPPLPEPESASAKPEIQPPPEPEPSTAKPLVAGPPKATNEVAIAPVAPAVEQQPADLAEEQQPQAPIEEICHIAVWRGYRKSRFYAQLETSEADEAFAVAESPLFRFRGNQAPEPTEAVQVAHRALVEKLVADGWESDDTAGSWYAGRFRRRLAVEREPASAHPED